MEWCNYIKYSSERNRRYKIKTILGQDISRRKFVKKYPLTKEAEGHLEQIGQNYVELCKRYDGSKVKFNKTKYADNILDCEYLEEMTLDAYLDELLEKEDYVEFTKTIKEYSACVCCIKEVEPFVLSTEFENIFGEVSLPNTLQAAKGCDLDAVFHNVFMTSPWCFADYEWVFDFLVPLNYVVYRGIFYYFHSAEKRKKSLNNLGNIYEQVGITEKELEEYVKMEEKFQTYIYKNELPGWKLYQSLRGKNYFIDKKEAFISAEKSYDIEIFYDIGRGFNASDSYVIRKTANEMDEITFSIPRMNMPMKQLRIDPGSKSCMVKVISLSGHSFFTNGLCLGDSTYLFNTDDPQIIVEPLREDEDFLEVTFRILEMSQEYATVTALSLEEKQLLLTKMSSLLEMEKNNNLDLEKRWNSHDSIIEKCWRDISNLQNRYEELEKRNSEVENISRQLQEIQKENDGLKHALELLQKKYNDQKARAEKDRWVR